MQAKKRKEVNVSREEDHEGGTKDFERTKKFEIPKRWGTNGELESTLKPIAKAGKISQEEQTHVGEGATCRGSDRDTKVGIKRQPDKRTQHT